MHIYIYIYIYISERETGAAQQVARPFKSAGKEDQTSSKKNALK